MRVMCIDNSGFEDQLSTDVAYDVLVPAGSGSEYLIENDKGEERWYGASKFNIVTTRF